ncbi:unnamed protein product [Cuscuta epithymum]|uniref:Uncharacterized protein n=1 Tax=Cuscuta epithymum TaxID=186058 RepID=A0AAV0E3X4_9ASTE|nr:unnamed protein product [Cuscuta epithymum]
MEDVYLQFPFHIHELQFSSPPALLQRLVIFQPPFSDEIHLRNNHHDCRAHQPGENFRRSRWVIHRVIRTLRFRVNVLPQLVKLPVSKIRVGQKHSRRLQPTPTCFHHHVVSNIGPCAIARQENPGEIRVTFQPRIGSRSGFLSV